MPEVNVPLDPMWARGCGSRDGARVPLPWTADDALNHGFPLTEGAAAAQASVPWLPQPVNRGTHAIELQQQDPESSLAPVTEALELGPAAVEDGGLRPGRRRHLAGRGWEPADLRMQR